MPELEVGKRWRPSVPSLLASVMVVAGLALTGISWWFLLLAAAGAFGPGFLRELRWLRDRDEFELQATYRAGYHAFLATGSVACVLVAFFRSGERVVDHPEELASLFLVLLWCTWFFSSLLNYWGPRKTAARVLYSFGVVWLIFTVLSNVGSEWTGWEALFLHPLLTLPFFVLAWLSTRRPRTCGVLLLVAVVFFLRFFGWFQSGSSRLLSDGVTAILFVGPLLASGIALIAAPASGESEQG